MKRRSRGFACTGMMLTLLTISTSGVGDEPERPAKASNTSAKAEPVPSRSGKPDRFLIVVGPSSHPPGTHEVKAGGRLLKDCLERIENRPGLGADVSESWPARELQDRAAVMVFIGDTFPANRFPEPARNLADLERFAARGGGIVCIHYATGLLGEDVAKDGDHPLLRWTGGYFANGSCRHHQSIARLFPAAVIKPAEGSHPILRGWREFTLDDEPYIRNYFGKDGNRPAPNVTILATSMLPPENPKPEPVAWCVQRGDGGRGFAIVMPHYYRNWGDEDFRRFTLNGILWSAGVDVPQAGVKTAPPRLEAHEPVSVQPRPTKPSRSRRAT